MIWHNFGDVNFIDHGGCLVKPHWFKREICEYPNLASQYDVFEVWADPDVAGNYLACLCTIDVDDYRSEYNTEFSDEEIAVDLVEQYGALNFNGKGFHNQYPESNKNISISRDELCRWLQDLDADEVIPDEYIQEIAYERYKVDWLSKRPNLLNLISNTVVNYNEHLAECHQLGEPKENYSFADYVDEYGFDGGISWACFDEFCGSEYLEWDYMKEILDPIDFRTYHDLHFYDQN